MSAQTFLTPPSPHAQPQVGTVVLVGAGPGDPELLTLKAARHLARADVILIDALANPALLEHASEHARVLHVGKVGGGKHVPQELTCALLVEEARAGHHVVRLKGGDPFVFGRGGEEALHCAEAGIPVEVVPGISSSVAGPAAAWIPVTHRGVATHFSVITATGGPSAPLVDQRIEALAQTGGTLVFLMPTRRLAAISAALTRGGLDPKTPAAFVQGATRADEKIVRTTVESLEEDAATHEVSAPAVLIVGEVVRVSDAIRDLVSRSTSSSSSHLATA